jgi:glycosyltransferase involved in cell wall biosynthesis
VKFVVDDIGSSAPKLELVTNVGDMAPPTRQDVRVSVVIPTLNEAANLPHVFAELPEGLHEVILVDGFSTDDTVEVACSLRPGIRIVEQDRRGKGNALRRGFEAATGDIIVMLDADGSADPGEIPAFVDALVAGADFAKGSRFVRGGGSTDITPIRRLGNLALNGLVNGLYGTTYTDLCYGYNAFWRHCLPYMDVDCDGFEVETLINIRIAKASLKVSEVPSFERDRIHGESNLSATRDGLRVLRTIARERFSRTAVPEVEIAAATA